MLQPYQAAMILLSILSIVAAHAALAGLIRAIMYAAHGPPHRAGECRHCRYHVTAITLPQCPECGTPIDSSVRVPSPRGYRTKAALLAMACLLVFIPAAYWSVLFAPYALRPQPASLTVTVTPPANAPATPTPAMSLIAEPLDAKQVRASVDGALSALTKRHSNWPEPFGIDGVRDAERSGVMHNSFGNERINALAEVLESASTPEQAWQMFFDATLAAYATIDLRSTSDVDDALRALMIGSHSEYSNRRKTSGPIRTLSRENAIRLVQTLLNLQAKPERMWSRVWGEIIDHAVLNDMLTAAELKNYAENAVLFSVAVMNPDDVRQGDVAAFVVLGGARCGSDPAVVVTAEAKEPAMKDRVFFHAFSQILDLRFEGRDSMLLAFLPDHPGEHKFTIRFTHQMSPAIKKTAAMGVNPRDNPLVPPVLAKLPPVTVTRDVVVTITAAASKAPKVKMQPRSTLSRDDRLDRSRNLTMTAAGGEPIYSYYLPRTGPEGLAYAMNVFVRQNGVEQKLGWAYAPRVESFSIPARGTLGGFDPNKPAEIVLRPDLGPLIRSFWSPLVWQGEEVTPANLFNLDKPD